MTESNSILANRIAKLERQLSNTKTIANTLLEENRQLLVELALINDQLQSSMLSEATAKQYAEEVDKQNQELAAQVEALRRELQACQNVLHSLAHDGQVTPAYANDAKKVLAATPQQHLAEIRAQAGRAGFVAGANSMKLAFQYGGTYNTEDKANHYADSIRRSEVE